MTFARKKPMARGRPIKRAPVRFKTPGDIGRDFAHMALVKAAGCVIFRVEGLRQISPTDVHHCKSGRYSSRRENDRRTIGLCQIHHRHKTARAPYPGDKGMVGFHDRQEEWERLYGPDYDYLPIVADMIAGELT